MVKYPHLVLACGCGSVPAGSWPVVHMCWRRRRSRRGPSPPDQPNRYFCSAKKTSGSVEENAGMANLTSDPNPSCVDSLMFLRPHRRQDRCQRTGQCWAGWVNSPCRRPLDPPSVRSVWHSLLGLNTGPFSSMWDGSLAPVGMSGVCLWTFQGYLSLLYEHRLHMCCVLPPLGKWLSERWLQPNSQQEVAHDPWDFFFYPVHESSPWSTELNSKWVAIIEEIEIVGDPMNVNMQGGAGNMA